jgi:hypothetical protein
MMIPYKNLHRLSSILAYELGDESIRIEFVSGAVRDYTYENVGRDHVEAMKKCAIKGKGLGSYVMQNERHFIALRDIRVSRKST